MYTLFPLTNENYSELSKLKILDSQKDFVKDFQGCVDYQKQYPFLKIYGIKKDDTYIGLTAFARWDDERIPLDKRWTWFDEFFLDYKYQHLGYGKEIVPLILDKIIEIYHPKEICLSVRNDNEPAKKLYKELGFKMSNLIYVEDGDYIKKVRKYQTFDEIMMFYKVK